MTSRKVFVLFSAAILASTDGFVPSTKLTFKVPAPTHSSADVLKYTEISPSLTSAPRISMYDNRESILDKAFAKFRTSPTVYLMIPFVAAFLGWFTNWVALKLLFCRPSPTADAVTRLLSTGRGSFENAFWKLNPGHMAKLLAPAVPQIAQSAYKGGAATWTAGLPTALFVGVDSVRQGTLRTINHGFLEHFVENLQEHSSKIFNLKHCMRRNLSSWDLVNVFHRCGALELQFLADTGVYVGFLMGILQMFVTLFSTWRWSLPVGGAVIGMVTNWVALQWLVQPIIPKQVGPFVTIHGALLSRQKEIAQSLSSIVADKVLTGQNVWTSILTDRSTKRAFGSIFKEHVGDYITRISTAVSVTMAPEVIAKASTKALKAVPQHVGSTFAYMDGTMGLRRTIQSTIERMSVAEFGNFLCPIVEHDRIVLIALGGLIGFAAGSVLGHLTGELTLPVNRVGRRKFKEGLEDKRRGLKRSIRKCKRFLPDLIDSIIPHNRRAAWLLFVDNLETKYNRVGLFLRFRARAVLDSFKWVALGRFLRNDGKK